MDCKDWIVIVIPFSNSYNQNSLCDCGKKFSKWSDWNLPRRSPLTKLIERRQGFRMRTIRWGPIKPSCEMEKIVLLLTERQGIWANATQRKGKREKKKATRVDAGRRQGGLKQLQFSEFRFSIRSVPYCFAKGVRDIYVDSCCGRPLLHPLDTRPHFGHPVFVLTVKRLDIVCLQITIRVSIWFFKPIPGNLLDYKSVFLDWTWSTQQKTRITKYFYYTLVSVSVGVTERRLFAKCQHIFPARVSKKGKGFSFLVWENVTQ